MNPEPMVRPVEILLVEDNRGDARLLEEALRLSSAAYRLHHVSDGAEAVRFLRREDPHAGAVRPDIIFLDLNLPKLSGREVLAQIKRDPELKRIPVIVLSTSAAEEDIEACYELHANCYLTKSSDLEEFLKAMKTVEEFWLKLAKLPIKGGEK